jgi:Phosphopantetheine attachment site
MVPASLVFIEEWPLTAAGKIDAVALRALNIVIPPDAPMRDCTPTEVAIQSMWTDLLRCEAVGINQNFFELGGHSLLATQLVSRVATKLHVICHCAQSSIPRRSPGWLQLSTSSQLVASHR